MTSAEPAPPAARTLTLYNLTDELLQMFALRAEMIETGEDASALEDEIARYFGTLQHKVDAVAHVHKHFATQEQAAEEEEKRLRARRLSFRSLRERLERYIARALEQLPIAARSRSRSLQGETATLKLIANGGKAPLEIYDESLVPDEFCAYLAELSYTEWLEASTLMGWPLQRAERIVSPKLLRAALEQPCPACSGAVPKGDPEEPICPVCAGSGETRVPGARLAERGSHVRIA